MRDVAGVVVLVCAATGWGCRGETIEGAAQSLKGVYKIESYTLNKGSCDTGGSAADHVLVHGEGKLRIEDRTRAAKDYPADDKGQCWTDKALAAAEGQACRQLTVYTAALQP